MRKKYTPLPLDQPLSAFQDERIMWQPMLTVRVEEAHVRTPRFPAVVDSSSPYCMFKVEVGNFIGIDVPSGIEDRVSGIIYGSVEPIYFHKVKIYIEMDWVIKVMAGFVKKLAVPGILGRSGFFDNFHVHFDHSTAPPEIEIKKIEKVQ